jgi:uncharacterized membrane protein YcaP (DUF421 family)
VPGARDGWGGLLRVELVGSAAYFALLLMLRASGKRTLSKMKAFDFVVTVAFGSTLATMMLSKAVAPAEGILALALLIALQYLITWLSVRSPAVDRLVKSEPALLLRGGKFLRGAMRRARVTEVELLAAARSHGESELGNVAVIVLETDGSFSVIARRGEEGAASALRDVGVGDELG